MAEYKDRVKDQTNTTGTGTVTIDGVAATGYRTIASAHTTGATVRYTIVNSSGTEWETGQGVWTASGATLTRATVYASSNSGSLVNFSSGAKVVFTGPVAQDLTEALSTLGGTMTGDLTFSGTGRRIYGDFSNATVSSRTLFQTSTSNANTFITAIPSGTAVNSQFQAYNASNPTNASVAALAADSGTVRLVSSYTGTGTLLPIVFVMNTTEAARIATGGNFLIGTATDNATDKLQVSGSGNFSSSVTASSFSGAGTGLTGTASSLTAGIAQEVAGGAANQILYQTAASTTSYITAPTVTDTFLKWNGSAFVWAAAGSSSPLTDTALATGFSIAGGTTSKTLTVSNTLTLAGTDGTTMTFPSTTGTLALNNQTFFIGTTSVAINRASGALSLTGVSIDGSAGSATTASSATSATTATHIAGGAANQIHYQTGAGATAFITAPTTSNTYLQWNGTAFVWASAGGGSAAGSNTQVQYNSGGAFAGSANFTFDGTTVTGNQMADVSGNLRAMALNSKAGAYTFIASDRGKLVPNTTGGWTVNASVFSSGDAVTVWNNSNAAQSIFQGASVTMYLAGTATTGTRTLAQRGIATIVCVFGGATPTFVISGSGLT